MIYLFAWYFHNLTTELLSKASFFFFSQFQRCLMACLVVYDTFVALHSVYGCCDAGVTPGISPAGK